MSLSKITGENASRWLLCASIVGGLAGCGSSEKGLSAALDSGAPDSGTPGGDLKRCESGSIDACGVFVTTRGTEIALGPYGAKMDENAGVGFENAVAAGDADPNQLQCKGFAALFSEDPAQTARLLDTKNPFTGEVLDFARYTVYRPASWVAGETYPVITWGNGTCAQPEGYGALLRYIASYGFVVIAANSRFVGNGAAMLRAVDFAAAANMDSSSPYYQKLDLTKIGAAGHSQGGMGTAAAARDDRIKYVILFNGGNTATKPFLAIAGDFDVGNPTLASFETAVKAAPQAAYLYYHNPVGMGSLRGHLVLMMTPERTNEAATGWFQFMMKSDAKARQLFVGNTCGLCGKDSDFNYGQHGLE
jgi:hypothetical protein